MEKREQADLLKDPIRWNKMRQEAPLFKPDLRGADLSNIDLTEYNLSLANLRGANLKGANLRLCDLSGADLTGADLTGANLSFARCTGAVLNDAKLNEANLFFAVGVERKQIVRATIDSDTKMPAHVSETASMKSAKSD